MTIGAILIFFIITAVIIGVNNVNEGAKEAPVKGDIISSKGISVRYYNSVRYTIYESSRGVALLNKDSVR